MNYIILTYGIYLPATVILTVWVGRTLFKNGRRFLVETFHGDELIADNVNKLLLVGFYLINMGYAVLTLKIIGDISGYREVIEILSYKIGTIILILGGMHFFNLYIFFTLRKRAKQEKMVVPVEEPKSKLVNQPPKDFI